MPETVSGDDTPPSAYTYVLSSVISIPREVLCTLAFTMGASAHRTSTKFGGKRRRKIGSPFSTLVGFLGSGAGKRNFIKLGS